MTVSYAENAALTCPACGERFDAEVWMLVDTTERPDLMQQLRDERLNLVSCPRCGLTSPAGGPLLLHDPGARRVYFAAPADAAEHEVREQAQALLYVLVGSLPEEARLPYLGDVQVEQELAGVRRAVLRNERKALSRARARAGEAPERAQTHAPAPPPAEAPLPAPAEPSPILDAVRALLAASSLEEFETVLESEPRLSGPAGDTLLADLADAAYAQGERDVAQALGEVRLLLRDRRGQGEPPVGETPPLAATPAPLEGSAAPPLPPQAAPLLSDTAFGALMRADSLGDLAEAAREHPALLEPSADDEIGARAEAAIDEGNDQLAQAIEARREALADMRAELTGETTLMHAIQTLVRAGDHEEALAEAISTYPVLLTDAAQEALFRLAAESRTRGDDALAERAVEYREWLRSVREGLEGDS